jgi:pimeloyl-ACP methyl ester carboxylesterase
VTEITHRTMESNGLRIQLVEAGAGPLVLLCHGFPESWVAEAGCRAVSPDMRGYGQAHRPKEVARYTLRHLVGDMVGMADALSV